MFRSLRFQLPALFLAGILLSGVVASLVALRLFQSYTREQSLGELRREARGLAEIYGKRAPIPVATKDLEQATGDRLFYAELVPGLDIFPGGVAGVTRLRPRDVPPAVLSESTRVITFDFTPPGERRAYIAASKTVKVGGTLFGALVVAQPRDVLRDEWLKLFERLALAFLASIAVAGALAWYLSRRITRPVLALARATDEVAAGRYDVAVPEVPGGGEIGELSERFGQMATRLRETEELERNFLVSVSHELRTPLTAIRGHVEALREGVVEDPKLRAASLDVIAAEAGRLERLVGDILDLAKLNARRFTVHREEVDMRRLIEQAYAAFGEEARRRAIDYRQELRTGPVIISDGDRVLQIISNLLANAFRWTPDGGRIELELSAENGSVAVAVEDSGSGIPPSERERIFRPFWSRDGAGTGLGLAIARELAFALGGWIELESEPGRGSRFRLILPQRG
ncbi:MAG: HAMP domain-containing histidine kinase [Actinobacteria bacterium]|nr:HAMP domain-containing histidine kinase [Actinomycetota bacterium]